MTISGRYTGPAPAKAAKGWTVSRMTPPSRLAGANGLRTGADGRIYVAQVPGSCISAIDPDSGAIEMISGIDGKITAPDDIVFDDAGNLFATELTLGLVSMLTPKGEYRVIQGDMPVANPITMHQGRLIAGECRPGGRIFELDLNGGAPRTILDDVLMPNAFEVGPDGRLYAPIMGTNEIWAIDLTTGKHDVVAGDLGVPDSVKFDSKGRIVTTQVHSGQVLRLDLQSGTREVLADLGPGLDNVTFIGDRIFVSSIPGEVTEILSPGKTRSVVPRALQWPTGLAVDGNGGLFIADGGFTYMLGEGGVLELAGMLFSPGFPGWMRGVAFSKPGEWACSTSNGHVARWRPAAMESDFIGEGLDLPYGVACVADGSVVVAECGAGRVLCLNGGAPEVLASGLDQPMGIAIGGDGSIYASEAGAGRIVKITGGRAEVLVDGLSEPQGIAVHNGTLYAVDVAAHNLVAVNLASGAHSTIAHDLPVGAPPGITRKMLGPVGNLSGPMNTFTGLACGPDGTVYVAADGEGSVIAVRKI